MKVKIRIGNEVKEYTGAWEDHTLLEVFQELGHHAGTCPLWWKRYL